MKKYFACLILILNTSVFASVDYNIKAVTRSYPVALSFIGTLGYGFKLWGSDSGPLYGYVRPSAYMQTSGVINGAGVQLDFFPVSFFGFYGGSKKIKRSTDDLGTFNCLTTICNGTMSRNYIGSKLGLAFKSVFLFVDAKKEDVEVDDRIGDFAEETGTLLGKSGGDKLTQITGIFGFELNNSLSLGTLIQYSQMDKINNKSVMSLGITRMKFDQWGLLLGAGQFYTRQSTGHFTIMALLTWTGAKGLQLL